jgi:hypothetical protein
VDAPADRRRLVDRCFPLAASIREEAAFPVAEQQVVGPSHEHRRQADRPSGQLSLVALRLEQGRFRVRRAGAVEATELVLGQHPDRAAAVEHDVHHLASHHVHVRESAAEAVQIPLRSQPGAHLARRARRQRLVEEHRRHHECGHDEAGGQLEAVGDDRSAPRHRRLEAPVVETAFARERRKSKSPAGRLSLPTVSPFPAAARQVALPGGPKSGGPW